MLRRALCVAASRGWSRLAGPGLSLSAERGPLGGTTPLFQTTRDYRRFTQRKKQEVSSHLDDIPLTMLRKAYINVPVIDKVDDVVRRMLSLEMSSQREKVKIKKMQLAEKVMRSPNDVGSYEVQVAHLTAKIRTIQEHLQLNRKDKRNRRVMLMAIDHRKKLLKFLRRTRFENFEHTCKVLGIEYTFPPPYCRKPTRRWIAKKAFCRKVFEEVKKLKAPERLKQRLEYQAKARAAKEQALQSKETPV
uniref:Small ribosomal subunit protein uS15m n=1 Tax=Sphenodon punctatus TaxID=8508 RepID=A0A8D0G312_SPHPU